MSSVSDATVLIMEHDPGNFIQRFGDLITVQIDDRTNHGLTWNSSGKLFLA